MRKLLILQPEFSGPHMKHYDPDTKQGTLVFINLDGQHFSSRQQEDNLRIHATISQSIFSIW